MQPQAQQQQPQPEKSDFARHTITVDVVPTIMGVLIGSVGKSFIDDALKNAKGDNNVDISTDVGGMGFAAQYEYQLFERMSLAARIAYLNLETTVNSKLENEMDLEAKLKGDVTLTSIEGHIRTYPFAGAFFLDAILGYTKLDLSFKGNIIKGDLGEEIPEKFDFNASQNYFKPGLKLGWRVSFGKNGGFTFEPAFNFCYATRLGGSSIVEQIMKETDNDYDDDAKDKDDKVKLAESIGIIGGPGFSLSFGYRF